MLNDTLNYNTLFSKTTENSIHWMQKQLSGLGIKEDFRKTVTQFQHCLGQTAACFNNLKSSVSGSTITNYGARTTKN